MSSTISNKQAAKQKALELRQDQMAFLAITTIMPLMFTGATMAGPVLVFSAMLSVMTGLSSVFWDYRIANTKEEKFNLKWIVDPSGYVYDSETKERLENVTVTAYWIPYEGSEDFWENKPADNIYGTKWNAKEYEQVNPLLTNGDGKYAWDVPEGWWRVKCELPGYETYWTDWMTVPPVQTSVNIGLVKVGTSGGQNQSKSDTTEATTESPQNPSTGGTTQQPTNMTPQPISDQTKKQTTNVSDSNTTTKVSKPAKVKKLKVSAKGKQKIKITWAKIKNVPFYQVQIATSKNFKRGKKNQLVMGRSFNKKKLKKGKTYYVRVRAYANGKYGAWSVVKKIKVK